MTDDGIRVRRSPWPHLRAATATWTTDINRHDPDHGPDTAEVRDPGEVAR